MATSIASKEMEQLGCQATDGHVVGEVMVAEEAKVTVMKKKKMLMLDKILGERLVFFFITFKPEFIPSQSMKSTLIYKG